VKNLTIKLHGLEIKVSQREVRTESASGIVVAPAANFPDQGAEVSKQIEQWAETRILRRLHEEDWRVSISEDDDADRSWMDHSSEVDMGCKEDHSADPLYNVDIVSLGEDWEPTLLASIGGVHMGPEGVETGHFRLSEMDKEEDYISGLVDDLLSEAEEGQR
jgi:hypothetical protein